jgi:hypothetical protein
MLCAILALTFGYLLGKFLDKRDTNIRLDCTALNTRHKTFLYGFNLLWISGAFSHCRHRSGTAGHIIL